MGPDELARLEAAMRERVAALPRRPADGWARVERRIRRYRVQRAATATVTLLAAVIATVVLFTMAPAPGPVVVRPSPVSTVPDPASTSTTSTTVPSGAGRRTGATGAAAAAPEAPRAARPGAGPGAGSPDHGPAPATTARAEPVDRPGNRLSLTSEPGDPVGQGQPVDLSKPDEVQFVFQGEPYAPEGGVRMWATNPTPLDWDIDLAPPAGGSLHAGTYLDARLPEGRPAGTPGLRVARNGHSCDEVFGSFTIHRIELADDGLPSLIDVSFVQHCDAPDGPALKGRIWLTEGTLR
jgi:hypothetical protein